MPSIGYGRSPEQLFIKHNGNTSRLMQSDVPAAWPSELSPLPGVTLDGSSVYPAAWPEDGITTDLSSTPDASQDFELTPVANGGHGKPHQDNRPEIRASRSTRIANGQARYTPKTKERK